MSAARLFVLAALLSCDAAAVVTIRPGQYAVESQMVLPHLDEMRRISEHHSLCIDAAHALHFFPVSQQPALRGCVLEARGADAAGIDYVLLCDAVNGASGQARLKLDGDRVDGALEAKMGGKNMTFSQFFHARREGECKVLEAAPGPR